MDRTVAILREHQRASAAERLNRIRLAVEELTNREPADDDRTIVLIKRAT